jgi:glutaredoxin
MMVNTIFRKVNANVIVLPWKGRGTSLNGWWMGHTSDVRLPTCKRALSSIRGDTTAKEAIRMEKLLFIYMDGCPYCHMAADVLANLTNEHPEYNKIPVEKVNETTEPEKLKGRQYYYVPTFFYGDEKIYEAQPGDDKPKMEKILGAFFAKHA